MAPNLHFQDAVDDSSERRLVLRGGLHNDENGVAVTEFRPYLTVTAPEHQEALADLLPAESTIAEAQLRWTDGAQKIIPA